MMVGRIGMARHFVFLVAAAMGLAGCATDHHAANINCLGRAGCTSGFGDSGYGPVHSQAVAPDTATPRQPFP
jgi:hypothetical protein